MKSCEMKHEMTNRNVLFQTHLFVTIFGLMWSTSVKPWSILKYPTAVYPTLFSNEMSSVFKNAYVSFSVTPARAMNGVHLLSLQQSGRNLQMINI